MPASLELKAEQLVAQNLVPAAISSVVPQSIRTLALISEPRLDAASETAWYLAASPNQIDTIEYAYLEGQQGAYIETPFVRGRRSVRAVMLAVAEMCIKGVSTRQAEACLPRRPG